MCWCERQPKTIQSKTAQLALGEAEIVALASFDKKAVTLMEHRVCPRAS
jgi:hypothetical protein